MPEKLPQPSEFEIVDNPNRCAAFRKMILRIVGAVIGGAVSLLAIILVTPNFETLPAYLLAVFIVFSVSAYCSLTSGRVAYAGKQIGTTFALVFTGLSPALDIYEPLWRIWGILLGTFIVAIVALVLWPEYAGDSLLPRLRRVIRDTLALAPGGSAANTEHEIQQANSDHASQRFLRSPMMRKWRAAPAWSITTPSSRRLARFVVSRTASLI